MHRKSLTGHDETTSGLKLLIAKEKACLFRRTASPSLQPLQERIQKALEDLAKHGLDIDAARTAFSLVRYVTQNELEGCWRTVNQKITSWFLEHPQFDLHNDGFFLQAKGEAHYEDFCRANDLMGRRDPPALKTVEEISAAIALVDSTSSPEAQRNQLRQLQEVGTRSVWILLWDLTLSGKTVRKQIQRIARCVRILRPEKRTLVHVATQIVTCDARNALSQACDAPLYAGVTGNR